MIEFIKNIFKPDNKGVKYQSADPEGIIQEFYNRLLQFDTTLSDSNLFYVNYTIPPSLVDSRYENIGETPKDGKTGINLTKGPFSSKVLQSLTIGVDLPQDALRMHVLEHGSRVNGFLPITVNSDRMYESTGLTTTFYDTNLGLNDLVIKPWIRLIAREGLFTNALTSTIKVMFLGKDVKFDGNVVRKMYTFYDCAPVASENKDQYIYKGDPSLIEHRIRWKFNRYDAVLTKL